jgi:hypothetical protein
MPLATRSGSDNDNADGAWHEHRRPSHGKGGAVRARRRTFIHSGQRTPTQNTYVTQS